MSRKITQKEIEKDVEQAYDSIVYIYKVTSRQERIEIAVDWCKDKTSMNKYCKLCEERRIPYLLDLIIASLIEVDHPLLVKPNGDLLQKNFIGARVDIIRAYLHNIPVPIPVGTDMEQLPVVPIQIQAVTAPH
jgi:hypothetical protein